MNQRTNAMFFIKYGPWALVAGASKGIGAAFAENLAARGLNLVLVARNKKDLTAFGKEIEKKYKVDVVTRVLDLAESKSADTLAREIKKREIGLLVYNAAYSPTGEFLSLGTEDHKKVLSTNCRGPLVSVYAAAQQMKKRGRGGIILMSSFAGMQGGPNFAHYSATKAYNMVLAEGLWFELKPFGVDVLACIAGATATPGYLESVMTAKSRPLIPVMKPEKVAEIALKNLGKKPSVLTGTMNRVAAFFLTRFMTRKMRVKLMAKAVSKD
ncbi:MAG: SDR family NAD(P)-dependent oxidoreductase [Spirochaetales bacterium]|nr:SDR family NAD(P)-dependent oxidoreductase [Spirochaetales bacterium]